MKLYVGFSRLPISRGVSHLPISAAVSYRPILRVDCVSANFRVWCEGVVLLTEKCQKWEILKIAPIPIMRPLALSKTRFPVIGRGISWCKSPHREIFILLTVNLAFLGVRCRRRSRPNQLRKYAQTSKTSV